MMDNKIKLFFAVWVVVILASQIFIFNECLRPDCLGTSIILSGLIAWIISYLILINNAVKPLDKEYNNGNNANRTPKQNHPDTKSQRAIKNNWSSTYQHNETKVHYPKFEFDIEGWSTDKVFFPSTRTYEYINLYTGDKYNKAGVNHHGKKKPSQDETRKQKLASDNNWTSSFKHKETNVNYTKFEFDVEGWSTEKVFFPVTRTYQYINLYTGDIYNKYDLDRFGNKKPTQKEEKKKKKALQLGWTELFQHKITNVHYPKFEFDMNGWSLEKVYLPNSNTDGHINLYTGDKYNRSGVDYYGKKKINDKELQRALKHGWNKKFHHNTTGVDYPSFEFDFRGWSKVKVYLPKYNSHEHIHIDTGDKYNSKEYDFHSKKKFKPANKLKKIIPIETNAYEKYIGTNLEKNGEIVIYPRLIYGHTDNQINIISINLETKTIKRIECKNGRLHPINISTIQEVYKKISSYEIDLTQIKISDVNKNLNINHSATVLNNLFENIKENSDKFTVRKVLYISSNKEIDLKSISNITQIKPNILKFEDMKIVLHTNW